MGMVQQLLRNPIFRKNRISVISDFSQIRQPFFEDSMVVMPVQIGKNWHCSV